MWWMLAGIVLVMIVFNSLFGHNISIEDAKSKLKNGAVLVDVRTSAEYVPRHHPGAINLPMHKLGGKITTVVKGKDKTILLYCHSGTRAAAACSQLRRLGYRDVHNVGGYSRTRNILDS